MLAPPRWRPTTTKASTTQPTTKQVWKLADRATTKSTDFDSEQSANAALAEHVAAATVTVLWSDLKIAGPQVVRDLWRQKDLPQANELITVTVPFHGAVMLKIGTPKDH